MHAYAIQDAAGLIKLDAMENPYALPETLQAKLGHRLGQVAVEVVPEELGFPISIGDIEVTECEMVNQFAGSKTEPPKFTRGYGLAFGHSERKAMAMSLVDRALRASELGEDVQSPAQMQEFVLSHSDSLEASGFVQHLKLPHYVDFQSELELVRRMRAQAATAGEDTA